MEYSFFLFLRKFDTVGLTKCAKNQTFQPALRNYCHYGYPAINLTWVILIIFIHLNKWGGVDGDGLCTEFTKI